MDNLINAYMRLRLKIDNEIIVTYYTDNGDKYSKCGKLVDLFEFSYIGIDDDSKLLYLRFFDYDCMIESIRCCDSNYYLYYNPYINDIVYNGRYIDSCSLYKIKRNVLGYNDIDFETLNKKVDNYIDTGSIMKYDDLFFTENEKIEFETFFNLLVDKLVLYAEKNGLDSKLEFIGAETTSIVYGIGDKVIKIGKPRRKRFIPYCEFLLQPIVNRVFEFDGFPIHIEVTEKAFVLDNKDGHAMYSDDEQFNNIIDDMSKRLYDIGLDFSDLHAGNVGILLKDNKIHYDSIDFYVGNEFATSILYNNNLRILKKGCPVIIDLDSLEIDDYDKYYKYLESIGYYKNDKSLYKVKKLCLN